MLERRAALHALALAPFLFLPLPVAVADPGDDDSGGDDSNPSAGNNDSAEDTAPEDDGHRPLGFGVTFLTQGIKVEVAVLSCGLVSGFTPTPTGSRLWEMQVAVHVISGIDPQVYLPGTFNFRAFYGHQAFQFYYPETSGATDSLHEQLKNIKVGDRITGKVRYMADRGPILFLGLYAADISRFASALFWDVPPDPSSPPREER